MRKPYGTWPSPISAQVVAAQGLRLGAVAVENGDIYWLEGRPSEGGRNVLVRRSPDGRITDLTPAGFNVRSRVHEYGGGAYVVADGTVYFSNFTDQRIYRMAGSADQTPVPITPPGAWFYADAAVDAQRRRLIAVREDHSASDAEPPEGYPRPEPVNTLVGIPFDGPESSGEILASGYDFYSTPRLSPDGAMLAWLAWRHPQLPWDGTELWVARVTPEGALADAIRVAGGDSESIYQPGWSRSGTLYFTSDRDGWWRLYRARASAGAEPSFSVETVLRQPPEAAEFGRPQWVFGTGTWAEVDDSRIVAAYTQAGHWHLGVIDTAAGEMSKVATDLEPRDWLTATRSHAVLTGGSAISADAVISIDLATGKVETLQSSSTLSIDPGYISQPLAIEFPTDDERTAHAFYYPPRNKDCLAPADERPPLMVISHGGPTTAASPTLDLKVQYWTSRGFAVVDVNYGGSSGYGRPYRERLNGQWGIVDVADSANAARYLVAQRKADPERLIIRGGSAGGYTTLAALTFHPEVFKAGASHYGISDLEVLQLDTHKFEARYSDRLIAPYPDAIDIYRARSPIHFVNRLSCPLILFQGLEDKIVPPNQSEMMAAAVRAKQLPVAYLAFAGEQHGFRKAETIVRSLEAELYFYGAVFGFTPADTIEPVAIDNLHQWASRAR